jgi:hypothetical protein
VLSKSQRGKGSRRRTLRHTVQVDDALVKYARDMETTIVEAARRLVVEGLHKRGYNTGEPVLPEY